MRKLLIGVMCCMGLPHVLAQTNSPTGQEYVYKQKNYPQGIDNYLFSTYYFSGKKTYNLRNLPLSSLPGTVSSLKINPSGTSYAVLMQKAKKAYVTVQDLWKSNQTLFEFEVLENPTAVCYTPDARRIILAVGKEFLFYNALQYNLLEKIKTPFEAMQLAVSSNSYYLAASQGNRLIVWNLETKNVRKEFDFDSAVNDIAFSDDNNTFAVLTADGLLTTYDTKNFLILQSFDALGEARSCSFHPEGKYLSVVSGDTRISVLNLMDGEERSYVDNSDGGITNARFVKDGKQQIFLAYNTKGSITYKLMSALAPFYSKLLADELNDRMNTWLKMMPGETLDEYNQRVNEETRSKQLLLFEQEIATRMADNLLERTEVTLGNYNTESNLLAIDFNTMPSIYLNVPVNEISAFMNSGNLEFRNAKYGLAKNDRFELIYADIYNKVSGKTYVFDNLDRQPLDFLKSGENFVPLELIQQSNMEEMKLQEIKEKIVNLARQQNTISDHTRIAVNAKIVSDADADGKKIMNYKIDFSYEVEKGYSAQEDFGPGKYKVEQSGAAISMLSIIKTAFETEFAPYIKAGKKLAVKITGMADAIPINGNITYDSSYGDFTNEPVYKKSDLSNISVTGADGITRNEQLAFLRAVGVTKYISSNIPGFKEMNTDYVHCIEVTEGKGGEYRRINVEFTFIDAF